MDPGHKNLNLEEKRAIAAIKHNLDKTIKEADKGGMVVTLDTKQYVAEAL